MTLSPFSERVRSTEPPSRVAESWPTPDEREPEAEALAPEAEAEAEEAEPEAEEAEAPEPTAAEAQVLAARNQLLVSRNPPQPMVVSYLQGIATKKRTTVFDGIATMRGYDIDIWILGEDEDVFEVTSHIREKIIKNPSLWSTVSPNHVVFPAAVGSNSPHGVPRPEPNGSMLAEPRSGPANSRLTLIDAGYQWNDEWGENPLLALCGSLEVQQAEWFDSEADAWVPAPADIPSTRDSGELDAFAGHANFVAGIIASGCNQPDLSIWNHNGSYDWSVCDPPLEAALARSILKSQLEKPSKLIDVSFSFTPYPNPAEPFWTPHDMWTFILAKVPKDTLVVAPAGNQGITVPRFPAAMARGNANLLSVAALSAAPGHPVAEWSNRGGWVKCLAVGEDVHSTFLATDLPLEDDPDAPHDFSSASASWSGTSFAAAKVTSAIARGAEPPLTPLKAYREMRKRPEVGERDPEGGGYRFVDL